MHKNREISFYRGSDFITKSFTLVAFLLITQHMLGQTSDNFSDNDFTNNLAWSGSTSHFIINPSQQLQLNNTVAGTSYLSAPFSASSLNELNWEFYIKQSFAGSASNFGKVYLVSDQAVLTGSLNGYYLQFGEAGTLDAVELFQQTGTTSTSVCRATNASIANSFSIRVKVSRDNAGLWKLYVDYSGGSNFVQEASGSDVTHTTSSFFGVLCTYTLSNVNKFFFDDFSINPFVIPDTNPPTIQSITVTSSSSLSILFSEDLDEISAETVLNYLVSEGIGNPVSATLESDKRTVSLSFSQNFPNGVQRNVDVSGVQDLATNTMSSTQKIFMFFQAVPATIKDIIITEMFADPTPVIGLPEVEFVEIHNRSSNPFDLDGWKITDGTSTGTLSSLILLPNEYLILTPSSTSAQFTSYGKVMGLTTFPSLNNAGDAVVIKDATGLAVDSVKYASTWYSDDEKKSGGWSLERIDPEDFCTESENWKASNNSSGGSPGEQNSVYEVTPDYAGPKLISYQVLDSKTIQLDFDERLSGTIPIASNFITEPSVTIDNISFDDATLKKLQLALNSEIDSSTVYQISVSNIFDCPGNSIQPEFSSISLKLDNKSPSVLNVEVVSNTELMLTFSETLNETTSMEVGNYLVNDGSHPQSVAKVSSVAYSLIFSEPFTNGIEMTLTVTQLKDISGNVMADFTSPFMYFVSRPAQHRDLIITEIFADPAPIVGLPEAEYIEIYNRSADPFDLNGWQITDGTTVGNLPSTIILPREYVVLTQLSSVSKFNSATKTIGLAVFPSLNNTGDAIVIKDTSELKIDSVKYTSTWYRDEEKKDGGWSLELIDPENFCVESENWIASNDILGGTPGKQNSVYEIRPDNVGPKLQSYKVITRQSIELEFDEKLAATTTLSNFNFKPHIDIHQFLFSDVALKRIQIILLQPLEFTTTYTLTASDVFDCPGNIIQPGFNQLTIKLDNTPPSVISLEVMSSSEIQISFSEKIMKNAVSANAFSIDGENPYSFSLIADSVCLLTFPQFANGIRKMLSVKAITDIAGNTMNESHHEFLYFAEQPANSKDIIITEIFADPSPVVGLPEAEFIEILNRSENPFDLSGWSISDGGIPSILGSKIILPGEYMIITASSSLNKFSFYGSALASSTFPSLNNTGDALVLKDRNGLLIDSLSYDLTWYNDDEKKDGGWSLELIYTENECAEKENWIASESETGGTPGRKNSVAAEKPDLTGPRLASAFATDPSHVKLQFNEKLESTVPSTQNFILEPSAILTNVSFTDKGLTALSIELIENLTGGIIYKIKVNDLYDCPGNKIDPNFNFTEFALPEKADSLDLVVNEILFNPRSTGVDFIEVYNTTDKFISLKGWSLANVVDGVVVNKKEISSSADFLLEPKSYLAFTEDTNVLKGEYLNGVENRFFQMDIPSLSDDEGSVVLVSDEGKIIDLVHYSDNYHSVFIQDDEGVSLERLSFTKSSVSPENWKSATSSLLATPGYANSNLTEGIFIGDEQVSVEPEVFIPIAGQPDFTTIKYKFEKSGYVAGVKIMDALGREIKEIASNELLGPEGFFRWDGDQNNGSKARIGSYMVYFEVFDERGVVKTFRKRVVVGAKF